jgi:NAD(P)-dependent dehydrogenase (short-subunit alcohol dehydrogenase family)
MKTRTALITGANRGIGQEVARELESCGFRVIRTSRVAGAEYRLDVCDPASVQALVSSIDSLDIVVNNAGIAMTGFDAEVARNTLETNFHGPVRLTDRILPILTKDAHVVNVSSDMGGLSIFSGALRRRLLQADRLALAVLADEFVCCVADGTHRKTGWPSSAYSVSKALLNGYTRVLARELAQDPRAIIVTSVCPGWVRTDMGGTNAPRSVAQGAAGIVWAATTQTTSGRFFRDGQALDW